VPLENIDNFPARTRTRWAFGLRGKMILGLVILLSLAGTAATVVGHYAVAAIREYFGMAFVRDHTLLNRQKVLTVVSRELVLTQRLAESEFTRRWMLAEKDAKRREAFFREAESFRRSFADRMYSVIVHTSSHYYFNDEQRPFSAAPRYTLNPGDPADSWYYATIRDTADYNLNVDNDAKLKVTKLWFNAPVKNGRQRIGVVSAGLELSSFLAKFVDSGERGVTNMIIDRFGRIQAHPDPQLIAYNSFWRAQADKTLFKLLGDIPEVPHLRQAMVTLEAGASQVEVVKVRQDGQNWLYAFSFMPELGWFFITTVDLNIAHLFNERLLLILALSTAGLLLVLMLLATLGVNRIIVAPLMALARSVRQVAAGDYAIRLDSAADDEIGELTRGFARMAEQVRRHTGELESRVEERTAALRCANEDMELAHRSIQESLRYAGLIQTAILPVQRLAEHTGLEHFILWKPRDVVSGDFYLFREAEDGCLIGVVDCAGHGVPGACMTMIAHAAFDWAINETGIADPARLLSRADEAVCTMLRIREERAPLATRMDVGLCYIDFQERFLRFAGAGLSLYWSDGECCEESKGQRRGIGEGKRGRFENLLIPLEAGRTFYMTTDGFLDQSGGDKGYGFGKVRFIELLKRHAHLPMEVQEAALAECLAEYQGSLPQRDDMTVLGFRPA
jgi:sigma-B regulation protein RsbU (phosphoserine phosphatase)